MKRHLIIVSIISAVLSAILVYIFLITDLVPYPYSTERESIDNFIRVLMAIASVFFSIVIVVFAYSLIFFRQKKGESGEGTPIKGNPNLERVWTLIPLVIVLVLSGFGAVVLNNITQAEPETEMEIDVIAARFSWQFTYPDYNITTFELRVPVNQKLLIRLQSRDVIHAFWVQEWGPKQDAVPGIVTQVRYTPNRTGQYVVQCAELCGYGHTYMTAPAAVVSRSDFETWVQQQQALPAPSASPSTTFPPTGTSSATPAATGLSITINISAKNIAFNTNIITVPAGASVTVNFDNQDPGIPHNIAFYTDQSASTRIYAGQIVTGPVLIKYQFTAPSTPGKYFFRCDPHATQMTGTFVVQ